MPAQLPLYLCIVLLSCYLSYSLLHSWLRRQRQQQAQYRQQLQVYRLRRQGKIVKIWLRHPQGKLLPKAKAGQHLLLQAPDLKGNKVSRAYSITSDCSQRRYYQLAVKAEPDGRLSRALWSDLRVGDRLLCSAPKGHFILHQSLLSRLKARLWPQAQRPVVLVAGGIGITPLLAMLWQLLRQRRAVQLWLQARTEADLALWPMLRRLPGLDFIPVLSQASADWQGRRGRIDAPLLLAHTAANAEFYLCANAKMVSELSQQLQASGVKHCYYELFKAAQSTENHLIELEGRSAQSAGYPSVLDALLGSGIAVPYDCRGGSCGQCRLTLKSGQCKTVLAPEFSVAEHEILSCCVQASSALQLAFSSFASEPDAIGTAITTPNLEQPQNL
ncbi:flavin reductase family protein [Rheinheimera sp. 4Y26]|uniref:flavin reductase family protein n=1 Tax=Rheinheimera sp. 4Y26 TaxID=2977811 RepID=UPI0021B0E57C|nr:flavin reductase family protein [Rheinheimera sp. 4Y26]MCT6698410.1 flavin reductase family protein [Rheinheimera sp. 4Y26]